MFFDYVLVLYPFLIFCWPGIVRNWLGKYRDDDLKFKIKLACDWKVRRRVLRIGTSVILSYVFALLLAGKPSLGSVLVFFFVLFLCSDRKADALLLAINNQTGLFKAMVACLVCSFLPGMIYFATCLAIFMSMTLVYPDKMIMAVCNSKEFADELGKRMHEGYRTHTLTDLLDSFNAALRSACEKVDLSMDNQRSQTN